MIRSFYIQPLNKKSSIEKRLDVLSFYAAASYAGILADNPLYFTGAKLSSKSLTRQDLDRALEEVFRQYTLDHLDRGKNGSFTASFPEMIKSFIKTYAEFANAKEKDIQNYINQKCEVVRKFYYEHPKHYDKIVGVLDKFDID